MAKLATTVADQKPTPAHGPPFESARMSTLYDLLGVRPDADGQALIKAYRRRAKAHHPDLNAGDPDATRRFTQITAAIEILRNPESRAAYDRQQRQRRRTRLIIVETAAAAVLVIVAVGRYALISPDFSTSTTAGKVENSAAPGPVARGEEQPAQRAWSTGTDEPRGGGDRGLTIGGERSAAAKHESAPVREQEGRQAGEREPPAAQPEAAPREQQERRQAEPHKASREIAVKREQRERRQAAEREAPKAEREAALRLEQGSRQRFGPMEIAATRAFARF